MTPPYLPFDPGDGLAGVLRAAADDLAVAAAELPDEAKRRRVLQLTSLRTRIEAELTVSVGVFDANTVWAGDGARSAGAWLAARTPVTAKEAAAVAHRGRELRACPGVEAAYRTGDLGTAVVRSLLAARNVDPERFAAAEADLLDLIAPLTADEALKAIAKWKACARDQQPDGSDQPDDPPGPDDEDDRASTQPPEDPAAGNALHLSRSLDGRWFGTFDADPVTGAEDAAAIDDEIDELFRLGTFHKGDGLTTARRRSIAHHLLLQRGRRGDRTRHGDPRPSVGVTIDARTLTGQPVTSLDELLTRECQLDDGTPVDRRCVDRLLCTARVQAFLVRIGQDGQVETLGVTDLLRDATRRQRRALARRDRGCRFPGCNAPPQHCQAHHLVPWDNGGPTLIANLVLLCSFHHHLVHEGGWRLWRHGDGKLHLRDPHGRWIPLPAHGRRVDPARDGTCAPDTDPHPPAPPLPPRRRRPGRTPRAGPHDPPHPPPD